MGKLKLRLPRSRIRSDGSAISTARASTHCRSRAVSKARTIDMRSHKRTEVSAASLQDFGWLCAANVSIPPYAIRRRVHLGIRGGIAMRMICLLVLLVFAGAAALLAYENQQEVTL